MILLENINKKYGKNEVIKNISLKINNGESIAFVGANGCGKTTLVEIISGVLKPTDGKVLFVNENGIDIKNRMGVQFQEGNWPVGTKVIDLIRFYKGREWKLDSYLENIIRIFDIETILKEDVSKLSGGQKQRFNCFLSIINEPKVLILDELITGLDLKMQIKLTDFFLELQKKENITLLIVSHIPEEVQELSSRVIFLKDGNVFEDISTKKIIEKYGSVREKVKEFFRKYY